MKIEMTASAVFLFKLSEDQMRVLIDCSTWHYDYACKIASRPGGVIFGWNNSMTCYREDDSRTEAEKDEFLPCHAVWRDLDICCKILEGTHVLSKDDRQIAYALQRRFRDCLRQANEKIHTIKFDVE